MDVPFQAPGRIYNLPPFSLNWSLRGSLLARNMLSPAATSSMDALFVHTLTVSLLASRAYERVPTVVSTDATPLNLDSVASAYSHRRQPEPVERFKLWLTRRVLQKAQGYVSWSQWAKDSLIRDYGVDGSKVEVITPGTDLELFGWQKQPRAKGKARILFVGGDFERKGGDLLLRVFRERLNGKAELHLVTGADVTPQDGVFVHRGLTANSPPLLELFRTADIFALPTRADCLAVVLGEAMASSLPIVTTSVGAHPEAVQDGKTGFVVPPDDATALGDALVNLVENPSRSRQMGEAGRAAAEERFDARANAKRILHLMESCRN
ncbi:MAG TPA: glycosyltransferase family 4 protein [Dehalococcoidia bacterium]|nr:glycosyltransferase family 4 protein [Dehalococcoidia bacterium]